MQRLIFEFQKTCDNNLSFEAFKHKIENQIKTFERQKISLDSLLGFENTRKIMEKKKREEMKLKKEEQERKKKEEDEKQQRREARLKKKKEEEKKKKEEEIAARAAAAGNGGVVGQTNNSVLSLTAAAPNSSIGNNSSSAAAPVAGITATTTTAAAGSTLTSSTDTTKPITKEKENSEKDKAITGEAGKDKKRDYFDIEQEDKLDISEGSILSKEAKDSSKDKELDNSVDKKDKNTNEKSDTTSKSNDGKVDETKKKDDSESATTGDAKTKDEKKPENLGEAIMKNEDYDVFKRLNEIAGELLVEVPDTFLPDEEMKVRRQRSMNNVIDLSPEYLDSLDQDLLDVKNTFQHFQTLVNTIGKMDEKLNRISANNNNYLVITEEEVLEFLKEYLLSNQIAEEFLKSGDDQIRSSPFFEDFLSRIVAYMEALTQMLKQRFYAFAQIQEQSLTVNFGQLKAAMTKFASLNLAGILNEVYSDLNTKIMQFMLGSEAIQLLFETEDTTANSKTFTKHEEGEEGVKIADNSTVDDIREYLNVLSNNIEKYFQVLTEIAKVIEATPLEKKLEELQDYLETRMEGIMKKFPQLFLKPAVLESLQKFDAAMNKLSDTFVFDMKGMAENIEATTLEEQLRQNLLSLKNQMYTQMQGLRDSQDSEDYSALQEIVLYHFLQISKATQQVVNQKRKPNNHKRGCLEVIVMNYQLFTTLIELLDSDLEKKTPIHYISLSATVRAVKEYFLAFIDIDQVISDSALMGKAIQAFSDLSLLECTLSDKLP